jgi:methylmalonyl-CoA epimerase
VIYTGSPSHVRLLPDKEPSVSRRIRRLDHVAVAVPDLDAAVRAYSQLFGVGPDSIEDVPDQKVRAAFFRAGDSNVELLCPTGPDSPIAGFLAKRGGGLHHVCFEVEDLEAALRTYRELGLQLIDHEPRTGAHGKLIAFMHPKSAAGVLIEFSEDTSAPVCSQRPRAPHSSAHHTPSDGA